MRNRARVSVHPLWVMLVACVAVLCRGSSTTVGTSTTTGGFPRPNPNQHVVFFNRIPKAGSTTLLTILRRLASRRARELRGRHSAESVHTTTAATTARTFTVFNARMPDYYLQAPFAPSTNWSSGWDRLSQLSANATAAHGQIYVNHVYWVNFTHAGLPQPLAIQMMREPGEREVSQYYYDLWGPRKVKDMNDARKAAMEATGLGHPPTINEYVALSPVSLQGGAGCLPTANIQTRFFCGYHPICHDICTEAALERAKIVLDSEYAVVGLLDRFPDTLRLLELMDPSWFANITRVYRRMVRRKDHVRVTDSRFTKGQVRTAHEPATNATMALLRQHNAQDVALFRYATARFERQFQVTTQSVVLTG
jgi:hypothetical protein